MKAYQAIIAGLGLPPEASKIAAGKLKLGIDQIVAPPPEIQFPPALIPLWLEEFAEPTFVGVWKHWFTPGRSPTFVQVDLGNGSWVTEHARTFEQLILKLIGPNEDPDEGLGAAERRLAKRFGIDEDDLPELDIMEHPAFEVDYPIWLEADGTGYTGDFPFAKMPMTGERLRRSCGLELLCEIDRISILPDAPPWFRKTGQAEVFDSLLAAGDQSGAWMSLNSPGWDIEAMRRAVARLADSANDPEFRRLADAWLAQKHERNIF